MLRRYRLVTSERRGSHVYYRITGARVAEMLTVARALLLDVLSEEGSRLEGVLAETEPSR